jgi:pSer/pThr/pTyr-binding forkhead associated (FHA) protein
MSAEKTYLCDEYKLYFKVDDDVQILNNELEIYNSSFAGNNVFCHREYIDGQNALTYSIPAMVTMDQFASKKIYRDELLDIMYNITDQLMYMKANNLSIGKVILSRSYMYLNLDDMSVQLIFLPVDKNMDKCNMEKFVREFVNSLNFANKKASDCGYEIIKYFDHNNAFYLSEFFQFITDLKKNNIAHPDDEDEILTVTPDTEIAQETPHTSSFKLAKEVKDYSSNDIGFDLDDDSDSTSTTVLTNTTKGKSGPTIIRTRTGEKIRIDKPIFCIGKSEQGVDYQVTDNNSVSRRHAYIINVNGVYYLRDNKSTNHTYLGGKIINSGTDMMLIDGSRFKLANEEFTFKEK